MCCSIWDFENTPVFEMEISAVISPCPLRDPLMPAGRELRSPIFSFWKNILYVAPVIIPLSYSCNRKAVSWRRLPILFCGGIRIKMVSFFGHSQGYFPQTGQALGGIGHWHGYCPQTGHFPGSSRHWQGYFPHLGHNPDSGDFSNGAVILALNSSVSVRLGLT